MRIFSFVSLASSIGSSLGQRSRFRGGWERLPDKAKGRRIDDRSGSQRDLMNVSLAKQNRSESMGRIRGRISFHEFFNFRLALKLMLSITFTGTNLKPGLRHGTKYSGYHRSHSLFPHHHAP